MTSSPDFSSSAPTPAPPLHSWHSPEAVPAEAFTPGPTFEEGTLESIADTVSYAASAIGGLRDVLERLDGSIAKAQSNRDSEARIGSLFVKAQGFINAAISDAKEQAVRITADAQSQAERMVEQARDEAARIVEESRRTAKFAPKVVEQLQLTIEGFNRVNAELVTELASLRDSLADEPSHQHSTVPAAQPITRPAAESDSDDAPVEAPRTMRNVTSDLSGSWMSEPADYIRPGRRSPAPRWIQWRTR